MLKRLALILLVALVGPAPAMAQSLATVFWLDPDDANSYAEFCRREYRVATKQDGPKLAAQMMDHQRVTLSTLPTPQTGQTGKEFWTVGAPEWWKRVSQWPPGSSKTGQASQNVNLSRLWVGLSSYQRMRATVRAAALAYQSLKGLRFEVNAWSMMKNLMTIEEDKTYTVDGKTVTVPQGAVAISVVPHGKENWRDVVKLFNDSPWDDGNHTIRFIGPTKLSDIALEANEVGGNPALGPQDAMVEFLEKMDAGARSAAEGLMTVQMAVDQRRRDAMNDAFSPRRLANSVRTLNSRLVAAYGSMLQLRSILEGRNLQDLQTEYDNLVVFADDQARAAKAQAEMSAKFYSDLQNQASNVVVDLDTADRQKVISKIEKEYEALFNLSQGDGLLKDIDDLLKNLNQVLTQVYPAMVPYVGGLMIPIDTIGTIKGSLDDANNDSKNPMSDMQAAYRDARIRALAIRLNWVLYEELKAVRRLASIEEQVAAANHGATTDKDAWNTMTLAAKTQNERAIQLYRLHVAADLMQQWGASGPGVTP